LKQATQAQAYFANPSPLIGAAILYLLLLLPLVRVVSVIEAKQKRQGAR
jgi:polar amino acid transport system permease protein